MKIYFLTNEDCMNLLNQECEDLGNLNNGFRLIATEQEIANRIAIDNSYEVFMMYKQKERLISLDRLHKEFIARVDEELNREAKKRGYDNINTAVSYAGYENAFQAEAIRFGKWRSEVWSWGYELLNKAKNGEIDPSSVEIGELLKDMPTLD